MFKQAENTQQRLFVPILVVLETIWVLQAVYGVDDKDILAVLNDLLLMPVLLFETQSQTFKCAQEALPGGCDTNITDGLNTPPG